MHGTLTPTTPLGKRLRGYETAARERCGSLIRSLGLPPLVAWPYGDPKAHPNGCRCQQAPCRQFRQMGAAAWNADSAHRGLLRTTGRGSCDHFGDRYSDLPLTTAAGRVYWPARHVVPTEVCYSPRGKWRMTDAKASASEDRGVSQSKKRHSSPVLQAVRAA